MKKVGEGYYYSVYELTPTRVGKKQTDFKSKVLKLIAWYWNRPAVLFAKISSLEKAKFQLIQLSKDLSEIPTLKNILGNPVFTNNYEYEQDRAQPLESVLGSVNEDVFLSHVQEYIDANILLWRYGYGELVYNFTLNVGISVITNRVILFDFNELTQSKERVVQDIQTKKWLTQASMSNLKKSHPALYRKMQVLLESAFTLETVEKAWESKVR